MTTRRQFVRLSSAAGLATVCGGALAQAVPVAPVDPPAPVVPTPPAPTTTPTTPTTPAAPAPAAGPLVSETEPQAAAVGYVDDARRADRLRFPKYQPGQRCGNCQLFAGGAAAPKAPCSLFAGREVQGPGWCSAHQLRVG